MTEKEIKGYMIEKIGEIKRKPNAMTASCSSGKTVSGKRALASTTKKIWCCVPIK